MTVCTDRGHHGPMIEEGDDSGSWQRCADCHERTGFRPITANPYFAGPAIYYPPRRRWPAVTGVLILAAVAVLFLWFGATTLG